MGVKKRREVIQVRMDRGTNRNPGRKNRMSREKLEGEVEVKNPGCKNPGT